MRKKVSRLSGVHLDSLDHGGFETLSHIDKASKADVHSTTHPSAHAIGRNPKFANTSYNLVTRKPSHIAGQIGDNKDLFNTCAIMNFKDQRARIAEARDR